MQNTSLLHYGRSTRLIIAILPCKAVSVSSSAHGRVLKVQRDQAGVFWPTKADTPATRLVTVSDHRMVWVDIKVKEK